MSITKFSVVPALWVFALAAVTAPAWAQSNAAASGQVTSTVDTATSLAMATSAAAADAASAPVSPQAGQTAASANATLQEVVVTGTQIGNGYQAPQPLTVLGTADLDRNAPINIADTVNQLPQMGLGGTTAHNSSQSISDGNAGTNNLDLLSLGANRTLVLLDGVRVGASAITGFNNNGGAVDINVFPQALISRVDVVTGGASAAYGSDAISGVVNFILNKTFTGLMGNVEGGVTTYGDDRQYSGSLTYGTGFNDDRGHFLLSGAADFTSGIPNGSAARSWVNQFWGIVGNYSAAPGQPFYVVSNHVGISAYTPGGLIYYGPLTGIDFGPGGVPRMFNFGSPNDGYGMVGGDYQETGAEDGQGDASLDARLSRQNLFARLSYDVSDNAQIFAQFDTANTHSLVYCCGASVYSTINSGNPFIPASVQAQMTAQGISSIYLATYNNTSLGFNGSENNRLFDQYLVGANGKFGAGWTWDVYATRSTTALDSHTVNNYNENNMALATDVVTSPTTGLPVCASTLTNPNNGCVPYNPMGIGVNSQAAIDYVAGNAQLNQLLAEDVVSATLRGSPFSDWAGPVSLAAGVVHRNESVSASADPISEMNGWWDGNFHPTNGSYHVDEGFLETAVPLAKDAFLAKSLDFNGAVRETDYSTSGTVTTWKLGLSWSPYSDLRLRATRSRDIRAPNLGELFAAGQSETEGVVDPFKNNQTVQFEAITTGNRALQPERADETTAGIVFQPSWLEGFSASFDWYHINIGNSIITTSYQVEIDECYAGVQAFCKFIQTSPSGQLTIYIEPANTAYIRTQGFDIEASYSKRLSDLINSATGAMNIHLLATHVGNLTTVNSAEEALEEAGATTVPTWRYYLVLGYDTDRFSAAWTGRGFSSGVLSNDYIQCTTACPTVAPPYFTINDNHLPGAFYMDASLTWHLKHEASSSQDLYLTVQNLANINPSGSAAVTLSAFQGAGPTPYETLGRIFRAGFRFRM